MIFLKCKNAFCRFTINLSQGSSPVFHFDARFNAGNDKNVLVRNTLQNGSWGPEERNVPYFPFFQNKFFEMIILADSECFKVTHNVYITVKRCLVYVIVLALVLRTLIQCHHVDTMLFQLLARMAHD